MILLLSEFWRRMKKDHLWKKLRDFVKWVPSLHLKVLKCFILIVFESSMKNYVWSRILSQLHKRQHPDYKYQPRRRRGQGADSPSIGGKGIVNIVTLAILSILFTLATLSHCQYCHIVNIVNIVNKRVPSLSFLVSCFLWHFIVLRRAIDSSTHTKWGGPTEASRRFSPCLKKYYFL